MVKLITIFKHQFFIFICIVNCVNNYYVILLLTLLLITDTTSGTSQVVAENIDLERNMKGPGKIIDIQLNYLVAYAQYPFHPYSLDKVNS